MKTEILIPMQNDFRLSADELCKMWEFVDRGLRFNMESLRKHDPHRTSLIAIARVPVDMSNPCRLLSVDGYHYFIRDGLHRCCIEHLYRGHLRDDEFTLEDRRMEDFEGINLECGWVTPFNPITHVRLADFHEYKQLVLALIAGHADETLIRKFIEENRSKYCEKRTIATERLTAMADHLWIDSLQDEYGEK